MAYLLSSVKEAESMSLKGLRQALKSAGVYEADKWDRFSLVATWLEHFGTTELDQPLLASEVDKAIDEWEQELAR